MDKGMMTMDQPHEVSSPEKDLRIDRPKILMVDDRPENLIALERLMKDLDVELFRASSGNEALKLTLRHDFALALLDIQMPEMDGYELAEILRSEEKTARMPFIFISAIYTSNINVFKGYEKGAFSYITKPFDPQVLLNKVQFFVEKYTQEQELKQSHKFLEIRIQERTEALQRSNRELEQFAYVASHDLQEPLRAITSYLQLLQNHIKDTLDEKGERYINVAVDGTKRMKQLIEALLTYSRLSNTNDEDIEQVDVADLVQKVMTDLRIRISECNAHIKVGPLPTVPGINAQLQLLFQNLIGNAIKFRREGVSPVIEVGANEVDGYWQFFVKDNGIGIEEDFFKRIFIIFQRLHTREEYEGTGIGLAMCQKVVTKHGGEIWVESSLGKGTTFHFTLPK
ncbi:MAG: response regulator [Flavobacteriales bacterium]|nr:response regulator [Flavobacteriales bacterium]